MFHKIAIFSDVHGNYTALKAVYEDMKDQDVTESWFMGDLFAPGSGAQDLWDLMQKINPSIYLRGNWDDLLIKGIEGRLIPEKPSKIYMAKLAQDLGSKLESNVIQIMKSWPIRLVTKVNNMSIALTHNLPDINFGQQLYPTLPTESFNKLFIEDDLDIAIYAHVHHPIMRYSSEEQLVLNPGSVGQPFFKHQKLQQDLRAEYLILSIDDDGVRDIDFRKVAYSHPDELLRAANAKVPYIELYQKQLQTGEVHTHDYPLLSRLNEKYGYLREVKEYNKEHQIIEKKDY
nr:metallophosphoesterase family protein [uncultured Ligilactobacillus sp.]